jgi:hypothetical protein
MTLDGEITKTKVLDLKNLCNFLIDNFFIGIICPKKITFKIQNFQTTLDREITKTKVIDPK